MKIIYYVLISVLMVCVISFFYNDRLYKISRNTIELADPYTAKVSGVEVKDFTKFSEFLKRADAAPPLLSFSSVEEVNNFVNNIVRYEEEEPGKDSWQLPHETLTKATGDCEDYAILKWYLLRESLQIPEEKMFFQMGIKKSSQEPHLILIVAYKGKIYYLDNISNDVSRSNIDRDKPNYVINRYTVKINRGDN